MNSQRGDGSFSGPFHDDKKASGMEPEEFKEYYFINNYHTTLMTALACFLTNIRDRNAELKGPYQHELKHILMFDGLQSTMPSAYRWLRDIYNNKMNDRYDFTSLLYILLGDWIYDRYRNKIPSDRMLRKSIKEKIDTMSINHLDKITNYDLKLVLLSRNILRKSNIRCEFLEKIANKYSQILRNYRSSKQEDFELLPIRFLL